MSDAKSRLMDHEYDGIREYDNPTPGWWHMLFWGSIVFAIGYVLFYHFSVFAPSIPTRWQSAQAAYFERLFGEYGELEGTQDDIMMIAADENMMPVANGLFQVNCAACHGSNAGGVTGPNLTDDHYINVASVEDLFTIITDGVVANGMPAWGNRLNQNQRVLLAAYVMNLRGQNAPGLGPDGEEIAPWPAPASTDVSVLD
ncbi:MAG: cbb3-type cytochrome c oxidase N-terminal domain-containing protein [Phycisphaerales bacterium]